MDYARARSEEAFAELVRRHVDLVYSAALRMVGEAHHAEDVTQAVFVALAQNSSRLAQHPVLSGWLHRTAQNLAANSIRTNVRRQLREQEAIAMNEPSAEEPDAWNDIAPHLDAVLNELNESDRDAVFLRYFEKKSAREIAARFGISDEAAQKRVNRAVERLREAFTRRGIAAGPAAIAAALAASAVHAAPVGLALKISTATAFASAGAVATTAAATKAIAMTTLQKITVTATIATLAVVGVYEGTQVNTARKDAAALRERLAPINAQLSALRQERDAASNQISSLTGELERMKSEQKRVEVLKLRGQVGALRRELTAAVESNANTPGFSKMMSDPAMREYIRIAMVDLVKRRYAAFFQEAKLSPEQIDQFTRIITDHFQEGAQRLAESQKPGGPPLEPNDQSDQAVGLKLKELLGPELAARMKEYNQEVPARTTVDLLNVELGASKLSSEQNSRLLEIVKAEPFELTHGIAGDVDPAFFGSQSEIDDYLMRIVESNQRVLQKAGEFLNADQVTALNTVLTNGLNARITQGAAFGPKR